MADYIKRDAVLKEVEPKYRPFLAQRISAIPAADVRPVKHGRWIDTDNYFQRWRCSVCEKHTRDVVPPFCPNCGAVMDEED